MSSSVEADDPRERWADVRPHDLLDWKVPKPYQQTIDQARQEGLNEAVRTGTATLAGRPVWADFAATAIIVSGLLFLLSGGVRTGWRALIVSLAIFAGIGIVIAVMGLDRGGRRANTSERNLLLT